MVDNVARSIGLRRPLELASLVLSLKLTNLNLNFRPLHAKVPPLPPVACRLPGWRFSGLHIPSLNLIDHLGSGNQMLTVVEVNVCLRGSNNIRNLN